MLHLSLSPSSDELLQPESKQHHFIVNKCSSYKNLGQLDFAVVIKERIKLLL